MGAAFSLVSLLVTVAILLWLMVGSGYLGGVARSNKVARQQVNVMAGMDPSGAVKATDSIKTHVARPTGGRPKLMVDTVSPGGPMDVKYGIRPGDEIVQLSGLDFEQNIGDYEGAVAWIHESYARGQPIVVRRDGAEVTLPTQEHIALIAKQQQAAQQLAQQQAAITQAAPAPPPAQPKPSELSGIQNMLDSIRSSPK